MTVLISYSFVLGYFCSSHPGMEKSASKASKLSLPILRSSSKDRLRSSSALSRTSSFSSVSNDSSVYGNSNSSARFKNLKKLPVNQPTNSCKRSRNSSGSSISSNISGISEKDVKSPGIISETVTKTEVKNIYTNDETHLSYTKVNSTNVQLKTQNIVNDLDSSKKSPATEPNQHNLRGKITKKRCTCCPSTCATVVLRRYKRYIEGGEEKTVISSTKVKTYVKKSSSPSVSQTNDINNALSKGRKRKTEMEKLYESLHEIEWAKNFSPDNILRQISVRQAASCSVFGHNQINSDTPQKNVFKKQKIRNNNSIASSVKSGINFDSTDNNYCRVISEMDNETHIVTNFNNCDSCDQEVSSLQTRDITTPDLCHCKQSCSSCSSHSSVNLTSCSLSHFNLEEISINSRKTVCAATSLENGTDYSDDAQLSYASDESSSVVSSNTVSLQSRNSLDFSYKGKNLGNISDTNVSEYSATPTFFDIAEEGIRTIDACFREVGAEVVVSTCYDEESPLPLLTSVKENRMTNKILDDKPPILEPCIDVAFAFNREIKRNIMEKCEKQIKSKADFEDFSNHIAKDYSLNNKKYVQKFKSNYSTSQNSIVSQNVKKLHSSSKVHSDVLIAARKILKKYLKQSSRKSHLKQHSKEISEKSCGSKNRKLLNGFTYDFTNTDVSKIYRNENMIHIESPVLESSSLSESFTSCETSDVRSEKTILHQVSSDKYSDQRTKEKVMLSSVKNSSCFYGTTKITKYPNQVKKVSIISQTSSSQTRSTEKSFVSSKAKNNNRTCKDHISLSPASPGFSCNYKSIRVNRTYNYTHVILLITRGRSIFLTLEALRELRDVVIRTKDDTNCQVLVINGVGDSFCSGIDLKPLVGPRRKTASTQMAIAVKELIEALSDFKKPLAAVVNGPALGLGMTLLTHADFTMASDKATFCMPYSFLNYIPEGGATLTLPQVVGSTVASDLILRGKTLTAHEACNIGLISEVLEAKRLPQELVSRVQALAENSLSALETTKSLLKMQLHVNLQLVLENEVKLLPHIWLTRTCQDSLKKALKSGILSG